MCKRNFKGVGENWQGQRMRNKQLLVKEKYQKIFRLAKPYYKKGREADEQHHLVVAKMISSILKKVDLDEDIMMAAALLHDIGYAKIPPEKRKTHWANKIVKNHMKFGAKIAREILEKVDFSREKVDKVCKIIATHDNPTIGLKIDLKEGKVLKEADILWMTTETAFWLDVKRRPELGASGWLKVLEQRFTEEKKYTKYLTTKFSKKRTKEFIRKMKSKVEKSWKKYV